MEQEQIEQKKNCIICSEDYFEEENYGMQSSESEKGTNCESELEASFFLRNLLEIPDNVFGSLRDSGDLSVWINYCDVCIASVKEAQNVVKDICLLQAQLQNLKSKIKNTLAVTVESKTFERAKVDHINCGAKAIMRSYLYKTYGKRSASPPTTKILPQERKRKICSRDDSDDDSEVEILEMPPKCSKTMDAKTSNEEYQWVESDDDCQYISSTSESEDEESKPSREKYVFPSSMDDNIENTQSSDDDSVIEIIDRSPARCVEVIDVTDTEVQVSLDKTEHLLPILNDIADTTDADFVEDPITIMTDPTTLKTDVSDIADESTTENSEVETTAKAGLVTVIVDDPEFQSSDSVIKTQEGEVVLSDNMEMDTSTDEALAENQDSESIADEVVAEPQNGEILASLKIDPILEEKGKKDSNDGFEKEKADTDFISGDIIDTDFISDDIIGENVLVEEESPPNIVGASEILGLSANHSAHNDNFHCCRFCQMVFESEHLHTIHEKIHTEDNPYECKLCGSNFDLYTKLRQHRCASSSYLHKCKFCGMIFVDADALRSHVKTHTKLNTNPTQHQRFSEHNVKNHWYQLTLRK